jgi:hypothetical protein
VEAGLEGKEETVLDLMEQCYMGPPTSKVNHISVEDYTDNYEIKSSTVSSFPTSKASTCPPLVFLTAPNIPFLIAKA